MIESIKEGLNNERVSNEMSNEKDSKELSSSKAFEKPCLREIR